MYRTNERVRIFNLPETNPLFGRAGALLNNEVNLEQGNNFLIILLDETINGDRAINISKYCLERM